MLNILIMALVVGMALSGIITTSTLLPATTAISVFAKVNKESASKESINYSDCLWYTARNYGFYQVQRKIVSNPTDDQNRLIWEQFVHSVGEAECGSMQFNLDELAQAMAVTVDQADQYFLSQ